MPVIEIAKIQMRRGPEIDMPGKALTTSPLVFEEPLDVGEFGYATDTGRLFIGHSPTNGQPNYARTTFPYQNVEVLTEASTDTLRNIFSFLNSDIGTSGFYKSVLTPQTDWTDVIAQRTGRAPFAYRFAGERLLTSIDYYILTNDADPTPVRTGLLRAMSDPNSNDALLRDDSLSARRVDLTTPEAVDPNRAYENVEFRITQQGTGSNKSFRFQYINNLDVPVTMYFSVKQPLTQL